MFCPECRSEFLDHVTRCAHCDVPLASDLPRTNPFRSPESMAELLRDTKLETLMVGHHVGLQEIQKELASQSIATLIAGEDGEEVAPGMHARFYLMVDEKDLDTARNLLQKKWEEGVLSEGLSGPPGSAPPEPPKDLGICPACSESVNLDHENCPSCGLFLGNAES